MRLMFKDQVISCLAGLVAASAMHAQKPADTKDVIVFTDDERLVGKFERSNGGSAVFKSDAIGEITVDWSKVKELTTSQQFAVIPRNVVLKHRSDAAKIPEGAIAVAEQKVTVTPAQGPPQTVALADTDHLIDKDTFEKEVNNNPGILHGFAGTITLGASLVEATQKSRAYNAAINLVRIVPDTDWLRRRNRTTFSFTAAYGTLEQPATPTVKTNIDHFSLERDEYFSETIYAFAQGALDHNFAQGLQLQQIYGGGLGWSLIRKTNESLDLKAGVTYIKQSFISGEANQTLAGSTFEEDFSRGLWHGSKFTEQLILSPAWTNAAAFSALGNAALTLPVYKRLNFTLGAIDNYLHNPPAGFKKNSFQATMGLTYSLR